MVKVNKNKRPLPSLLTPGHIANKSEIATQNLEKLFDQGIVQFDFDTNLFNHPEVKNALLEVQHNKCCFCESYVVHVAHGDIEHFRPKSAIKITPNEPLSYPGYYWLVYDYTNLFFSCQICNQIYKRNFFPLEDEQKRVRSHHFADQIAHESPLLINPDTDNPDEHIFFNREIPIGITEKGKITIQVTGIDNEQLNNYRLKYLQKLDDIARHATKGDQKSRLLLWQVAQPEEPYSMMIRHNYAKILNTIQHEQ